MYTQCCSDSFKSIDDLKKSYFFLLITACMCPCDRIRSQNFIHDPEVLQNKIAEMKKELEVNQKQLSSAVRAKTSAKDERPSAKGVGSILGVGMITFVLVTIVCSDLPMIYRQVRYGS